MPDDTKDAPGRVIDRATLVAAFDAIGAAAIENDARLEIAVYGGSALMLAGNFRFATEDVDMAEIERPWPRWLEEVVASLAVRNGWSADWLNEAVTFHLSGLASQSSDHVAFGTYPRGTAGGLSVVVPKADYMLALKLKAIRILDPVKGQSDADDIYNLMRIVGVGVEGAMAVLAKFFPKSAIDDTKRRFLLQHLQASDEAKTIDAPVYPG